MYRRSLFLGLLGAVVAPVAARAAATTKCFKQDTNTVDWTVPKDIKRIRVQSWSKEGDEVIDTHFRVRPGQKFRISAVNSQ